MSSTPSFFEAFGIQPNKKKLYHFALTHRSYSHQHKKKKQDDQQERLEFFGDAVLKFVVSYYLMMRFPEMEEGKLTKIRARLISDSSLSNLGKTMNLHHYVRVSDSERVINGNERPALLSDTFEAILGAMYMDKGMDYTKQWVSNLIETHMNDCLDINYIVDHKTYLQEISQKKFHQLPDYECYDVTGPEHKKVFFYKVTLIVNDQSVVGYGDGDNKKSAQQFAAKHCIELLKSMGCV